MEITLSDLYERIGRLDVQARALAFELERTRAALAESSRVAGEALRKLEELDYKEIADAITRGTETLAAQ